MRRSLIKRALTAASVLVGLAAAVAACLYLTREVPFFRAAGEGRVWQVRLAVLLRPSLLRKRLNDGFTALHLAAIEGDLPMIDCLVRHGSDIDARAERGIEIAWRPWAAESRIALRRCFQ